MVKAGVTLRTVSFKYDPFGRRVEKRVTGLAPQVPVPLTTTYLYDGADIVLESVADGSTTVTTQYVHGPGIDEPLALMRNGQSYFYHADGLGSIVALTDSQKQIVQRYSYDAFGMLTPSHSDFANPYTYTGREWDPETGLYFYRARYYDAMEGRFISKDPIGFAGGDVNLYRYVQNNSANYIDPLGEFRFGTRPLGSAPFKFGHSGEASNRRLLHEQGFYDNGDNVGYFPQGIDRDDPSNLARYEMYGSYYDDTIMKQAEENLRNSGNWNKKGSTNGYDLGSHNCQNFADALREEYDRLGGQIYDLWRLPYTFNDIFATGY